MAHSTLTSPALANLTGVATPGAWPPILKVLALLVPPALKPREQQRPAAKLRLTVGESVC
jgi:hypothetical protein